MKIERASLYLIKMNLRHPFRTSFGETNERDMLLISLESEGIKGWGECVAEPGPWYSGETINSCQYTISEFIIPWIKEREISHPKEFKNIIPWIWLKNWQYPVEHSCPEVKRK